MMMLSFCHGVVLFTWRGIRQVRKEEGIWREKDEKFTAVDRD
jgi:hypothetical protein